MTMRGIRSEELEHHSRLIAASKKRCARDHGLRSNTLQPILRLQTSEVAPRFEHMVERSGGRQGIVRQLADVAVKAEQCLVVSDADGVIVRLEGDSARTKDFQKSGIAVGSCWNERQAGTSGIGMAMSHRKAITVRGNEHFFETLHPFACSSVPLIDAEGQLFGALTLSTLDKGGSAEYVLARQLLSDGASRIRYNLFKQRFRDELTFVLSSTSPDAPSPSTALVAVDEAGGILGTTADVHQLLGMVGPTDLLGKSLAALLSTDVKNLNQLRDGVHRAHTDAGLQLKVSIEWPGAKFFLERGQGQTDDRLGPRRIRRSLAPRLRELALGSDRLSSVIERGQSYIERAIPFIVEGESGTGKSALVTALHTTLRQSEARFVTIDCALLDQNPKYQQYLDTVLKRLHCADVSSTAALGTTTLVLDNVGELPSYSQAKVRSCLATMETEGPKQPKDGSPAALRVVSISATPLKNSVEAGRFRADLFFLLSNGSLELPPLRERERPELLARAIANRLAGADIELTEEAIDAIRGHTWPGNVRELRNALRKALIEGDGRRISLLDLQSSSLFDGLGGRSSATTRKRGAEHARLLDALQSSHWNVSRAARRLGIGRATIHRKMKRLGIARPDNSGKK